MKDGHAFRIRLASPDVDPDTVTLKDLAQLLDAFHSLLSHSEFKPKGFGATEPLVFSLVDVKDSGSTTYFATVNDPVRGQRTYANAAHVLRDRWKDSTAARYARRIREIADRLGTPIECYSLGAEYPDVVIEVGEIVEPAYISGSTILYGTLERVGGADPKAILRTRHGTVAMTVDRDFAKKLAPKLYSDIGVTGTATWDAETWEIRDFKPKDILDYEPISYTEAFEELAEAGPRAWTKEYLESDPAFFNEGAGDT